MLNLETNSPYTYHGNIWSFCDENEWLGHEYIITPHQSVRCKLRMHVSCLECWNHRMGHMSSGSSFNMRYSSTVGNSNAMWPKNFRWTSSIPCGLTPSFPPSPGLILTPACIINHMSNKMWGEITYPFPNFNGCTMNGMEYISNFTPHLMMDVITYPCWDLS